MKRRLLGVAIGVLVWGGLSHAKDVEGIVLAYHDVLVSAPAQNKLIVSVLADEGATVQEGQVLANLESKLEELEVSRLAKILEKREFENTAASTLRKEKFISKDEALERSLEWISRGSSWMRRGKSWRCWRSNRRSAA